MTGDEGRARQREFFDEVKARSEAATLSCGTLVRDLELAGQHIRLIFAGPALERQLMPAIDHLRADRCGEPDLVCYVWDSASSGVAMARAPVARGAFSERGDIAGFDDDRILIAFQPNDYSLSLFDVATRTGIYWVEDANDLPYWTQAAPFRTLFHWWVEQTGGVLVHGAVVGNDGGGVLITGKGGIGKSTTALSCLAAGFRYVGDDYVALYPGASVVAHALYCTAKLNPDNAARFAAFAPRLLGVTATRGEAKMVAFLPRGSENGVTSSLRLTAILTPRFADGADSSIEPADPAALLVSAAATSLAQLPGAGARTVDRIARIVARLPGHAISLGTAVDEVPAVIAGLLRNPGQPGCEDPELAGLPFLSLIVRVEADAASLADTFADILAARCPRMEAIIVDDGAPGLEPVVEMLPFQPRIVRGNHAGGTAGATGEVVAVLKAGDRLAPGVLRRVLEMFQDDPRLDLVDGMVFRRVPCGGLAAPSPEPLLGIPGRTAPPDDARPLALGLARQALKRKRAIAVVSPLGVSVVMAVRNGEAYLADALASIFRSRRRPLEILLIDGGSTDRTAQVAAGWPLTRVIRQPGRGIAAAYNLGIAQAGGNAIAFLSHDDLWADGKLDMQIAAMEADPSLMLSVGMVRHALLGEAPPGFRTDLLGRDVPGYIMETLVARREAFALVGGFDTALATAEDVDWFSRARDVGLSIGLLPQVLLTKRVHGSNASLTDEKGSHNLLAALRGSVRRKRGGSSA